MAKVESELVVDVGGTSTRFFRHTRGKLKLLKIIKTRLHALPAQLKKIVHQTKPTASHITIGMRGVWTPQEKNQWRKKLSIPGKKIEIMSDVELAHHQAFGDGPGIILLAGTGSIAYGVSKSGIKARAGGLGPFWGDEGSGFWMGKEYLKRTDTLKILRLRKRTADPMWVSKIASFAPCVLKGRSLIARAIRKESIEYLLRLIRSVRQQLKWRGQTKISLGGGLFQNPSFRRQLTKIGKKTKLI